MQIARTLEDDKESEKQTEIISVLEFAVPIHLLPEFHAVEHRGCVFHPKDILPSDYQVL